VLQPGDYKVTWQGNGPTASVTFQKGKTTVATAPAKVETVDKNQQTSVQMDANNGTAKLQKLNFSHVTLDFAQSGGSQSGR
jgi:hypothetical protein